MNNNEIENIEVVCAECGNAIEADEPRVTTAKPSLSSEHEIGGTFTLTDVKRYCRKCVPDPAADAKGYTGIGA